ncbi:polysialoglycoprotein, partial [Caerostris darwini]
TAVGQAPTKTITQEEVVGPLGDSQIVTTVTKTEQAPIVVGPSKIGGLATGGPLGVAAIARSAPAAIVQQEEVLNPITGLRTTSQLTQEITQDPIETAISQAKLATPFSQALVDPLMSGQTNIIDSDPITQVRETTYSEPLSGTVTKVTEVSNAAPVSSIVQQNIADTVVQESISPVIGGGARFSPRVTFLSQHPYDVPGGDILRSIVTRPVIQQQHQELEQILVKK